MEIRTILHDISLRLVRDDLEDYEARPGEVRPTDKAPIIAINRDGASSESAKFGFKKWDGKGLFALHSLHLIQIIQSVKRVNNAFQKNIKKQGAGRVNRSAPILH